MIDEVVTVRSHYEQRFPIVQLGVEPSVTGKKHEFSFEGNQLQISYPLLPEGDVSPKPIGFPAQPAATIFMWNKDKEPLGVAVNELRVSVPGLSIVLPLAVARSPSIDVTLFSESQRHALDDESDKLFFLAERPISYWLRLLWWKTGFHAVQRLSYTPPQGVDGGNLVNTETGARYYTPPISRTIKITSRPIMTLNLWLEIDHALRSGLEPPIWREYLTSARQRAAAGDTIAAILDLAVATESRFRTFLDSSLPSTCTKAVRKAIRRQNASEILANWRDFGFPTSDDLTHVKLLFEVRNGIMHSGIEKRASISFFKTTAEAVGRVLAKLDDPQS